MKWNKIAVIAIIAYLAITLPLYVLDSNALKECNNTCIEQGFDRALVSTGLVGEIQCKCFEKHSGLEKWITIG